MGRIKMCTSQYMAGWLLQPEIVSVHNGGWTYTRNKAPRSIYLGDRYERSTKQGGDPGREHRGVRGYPRIG